jgi:hypothetical protein
MAEGDAVTRKGDLEQKRRRLRAACVFGVLGLLAASTLSAPAQALPTKEYRVQEPTRCSHGRGCGRMLRNAVNQARTFCQAEGGVLRGERTRDFRCEQRAIYCVVSGRIECHGRLDPRDSIEKTLGLPIPTETKRAQPDGRTCLDANCARYIDHAPGRREEGLHACPNGHAMIGMSGRGYDIVCQVMERPILESRPDRDTLRTGMHACPVGWLMRGMSDDLSVLLCSRLREKLGAEIAQDETDNYGMQVCGERDGAQTWLTGIDGARSGLLCARAE